MKLEKKVSKNPFTNTDIEKLQKSKKSFEKLIKEHQQKLDDFKKDPIGNTDPKKLKEMSRDNPSKEELLKRVKGRIPALEKQLKKQKGELKKINETLKNKKNNP